MTETITHIALKPLNHASGKDDYFKVLEGVKVSRDDRDCLVIHAPHITEEPIVTNDIVELRSDTTFEYIGRLDNVINSGGVKLHPEQIEAKLGGCIDCRYFVTSIPHNTLGEQLVLILESDTDDLPEDVFAKLDRFEIPKAVYAVPKFLETDTGKVQRTETLKLIEQWLS